MQGYFIGPCQKVSQKFETKSLSKLIYSITLKLNVKVVRIKEMITNLRSSLFSKTIIVSIIGSVRRTGWIIWMLRVGKERVECHQIFGLFYSLAKRIWVHSHSIQQQRWYFPSDWLLWLLRLCFDNTQSFKDLLALVVLDVPCVQLVH